MKRERKYELTNETKVLDNGTIVHRIRALKDFGRVRSGDFGGWVENKQNLSQEGNAWLWQDACVCEDAYVCDDAQVVDHAMICGHAEILQDAYVSGCAKVDGGACVFCEARISDHAQVGGNAEVSGGAWIFGRAVVAGNSTVSGDAKVGGDAIVTDHASLVGNVSVFDQARIDGNVKLCNSESFGGNAHISSGRDYIFVMIPGMTGSGLTFYLTGPQDNQRITCGFGQVCCDARQGEIKYVIPKYTQAYFLARAALLREQESPLGRWEDHRCSVCGGWAVCVEKGTQATYILTPCCPTCGARMEVEQL